jgi:predicted metal-dependent hydrolase
LEVVVVRSKKRRKTISASVEAGKLVVRIPFHFTKAQELTWVERMRDRVTRKAGSRSKKSSDVGLFQRSEAINDCYFGGRLKYQIRWVANQKRRWGSCTSSTGEIRLSDQLQPFPAYVIDYVIVHELAHLIEANHGEHFWRLVRAFPHTDKAMGFLDGFALAQRWEEPPEEDFIL